MYTMQCLYKIVAVALGETYAPPLLLASLVCEKQFAITLIISSILQQRQNAMESTQMNLQFLQIEISMERQKEHPVIRKIWPHFKLLMRTEAFEVVYRTLARTNILRNVHASRHIHGRPFLLSHLALAV